MSGDFSQMYLVRKLIASWLIEFVLRTPPGMGWNRTCGMHTGICRIDCSLVLSNHLSAGDVCVASIREGVGAGKGCRTDGLQVISGMLPGMLFLICCKCVLLVNLRVCFAVGLGAATMGGASVICCRGSALAWWLGVTLCSTLCSGWVMMSTLCRLPRGISHSWVWLVSVLSLLLVGHWWLICFWYIQEHQTFLEQVTLSMLLWACQSPPRGVCSTWGMAPGNAGGTIWQSRISGMAHLCNEKMIALVVVQRWTDAPCINAPASPQTL